MCGLRFGRSERRYRNCLTAKERSPITFWTTLLLLKRCFPIEEMLSEKAELDQLFERLQELVPEAKRIGELREEGSSPPTLLSAVRSPDLLFL